MPDLPRFLAHFDQNYKIFATKLRFRIRRVVLERVAMHGQDGRNEGQGLLAVSSGHPSLYKRTASDVSVTRQPF